MRVSYFLRVNVYFLVITLLFMQSLAQADSQLPNFTQLVEDYSPAIVNISTTQKIKHPKVSRHHALPGMPNIPDGPFGDLFRRFFEGEGRRDSDTFKHASLGSGFIISADGYVLTNHHVIKNASEIIVRLSDRRELVAKVIGSDEKSDVALLKIEAENLPTVKMDRKSDVKVGEWVLAIGSPFGFEATVTAGIVSATGRSLPRENYVPFIQTDVAINPGNSGGPLFDVNGNVVGINSQIFSRTGGFMGLSFAIPVKVAMTVVEQIKEQGFVSRGWLGVLIQDVTRELAESMSMSRPEGALISQVLADSPAKFAGILVGDVVVEFAGKPVHRSSSLPPIVGLTQVGSVAKVKVIRNGKPLVLSVTLGALPGEEVEEISEKIEPVMAGSRLGLQVTALNTTQQQDTGMAKQGVLVIAVESGAGRKAGIRKGDVILMINNTEIDGIEHFTKFEKELPSNKSIRLLVRRGKSPLFLALKID